LSKIDQRLDEKVAHKTDIEDPIEIGGQISSGEKKDTKPSTGSPTYDVINLLPKLNLDTDPNRPGADEKSRQQDNIIFRRNTPSPSLKSTFNLEINPTKKLENSTLPNNHSSDEDQFNKNETSLSVELNPTPANFRSSFHTLMIIPIKKDTQIEESKE